MATVVLGAMGAAAGSMFSGVLGATAGRFVGSLAGRFLDQSLFRSKYNIHEHGSRLKDLQVIVSTYGNIIPQIFGTVRIAGNIIWAQPIKEISTNRTYTNHGKGAKAKYTKTDYEYFATFAVSICQGPIDEIVRIYAGNTVINHKNWNIRVYLGTEDQEPDHFIESICGMGKTPAYRGQAYVVFQDIPLADFGNQIPNINFEIRKNAKGAAEETIEDLIDSICIIPGGGEFVYDTIAQYKSTGSILSGKFHQKGKSKAVNVHDVSQTPDAVLSIQNLKKTLHKVEWVSVIVSWFATSLDIADCQILPGVEYQDSSTITYPDSWHVGKYNRYSAYLISQNGGRPNYGGTICDASIQRYIRYLKEQGYKVVFYPMIFVDLPSKPWRGYITGSAQNVSSFFNNDTGYNNFILHYANLVGNDVDGFIIGSEMKALTAIKNNENHYPAVDELINLATQVKNILPKNTIITYGADWSEYHNDGTGFRHLDPLWASRAIDRVGIDAYFPISDSPITEYDIETLKSGWDKGEFYDYYYDQGEKKPLDTNYALKNLEYWWTSKHLNPDGTETAWEPKMKRIWFTEYGFPSVDCASNQPNVFYDGTSQDSAFPKFSKGLLDLKHQRNCIIATNKRWAESEMVEKMFLWCWDARPYPEWPDLKQVWSDYKSWQKGHWVQGKCGFSSLTGVIESLCTMAKIPKHRYLVNHLNDQIEGLIIDSKADIRKILGMLQTIYEFDIIEKDGRLVFSHPQKLETAISIDTDEVLQASNSFVKEVGSALSYSNITINYFDRELGYKINTHQINFIEDAPNEMSLDIPIVASRQNLQQIAERLLWYKSTGCYDYSLNLPPRYLNCNVGDMIKVGEEYIKVSKTSIMQDYSVQISGISYKPFSRSLTDYENHQQISKICIPDNRVHLEIFELPNIEPLGYGSKLGFFNLYFAASFLGNEFRPINIFISTKEDEDYTLATTITKASCLGHLLSDISTANECLIDNKNKLKVGLLDGDLLAMPSSYLAQGANLLLVGDEIIQYRKSELKGNYEYEATELFRNLYASTSHALAQTEGTPVVLLEKDQARTELSTQYKGQTIFIKAVPDGCELKDYQAHKYTCKGLSLLPPPPSLVTHNTQTIKWLPRIISSAFLQDYIGDSSESHRYLLTVWRETKKYQELIYDKNEIHFSELPIAPGDIIEISTLANGYKSLSLQMQV